MSDPTARELLWLRRVRDLSRALTERRDPGQLFGAILDAAIELTDAERGFVVQVLPRGDGHNVKIKAARGFDRAALQASSDDVSKTVVERVLERGRGLVTTSEDADVLDASSVQARRVRAIMCAPMLLRGELRGILYLDHRFSSEAFSQDDLPILATFADQAALALETASLLADRDRAVDRLGDALRELDALKTRAEVLETVPDDEEPELDPRALCFGGLIGSSACMHQLFAQIERAARTWAPVLILGESGTGKELIARELHQRGTHPGEPFFSENCAALVEGLLESEFFGHVRGAFTGAHTDRQGLFVEAGHGTLVLDEVGDMPLQLQAKLLRVLQEGVVRPIGGDHTRPVRCRIVASTHQDLPLLVEQGRFREDLFYRLDVIRLVAPPLRRRRDDIPLLIRHFAELERDRPLRISARAMDLLVAYAWPGNVRELQNEVRRLCTLRVPEIDAPLLSPEVREGRGVSLAPAAIAGKTLGEVEKDMIEAALFAAKGNKAQAARQLGVPRSTLYGMIERYGL